MIWSGTPYVDSFSLSAPNHDCQAYRWAPQYGVPEKLPGPFATSQESLYLIYYVRRLTRGMLKMCCDPLLLSVHPGSPGPA
jgi:hypothetical protein